MATEQKPNEKSNRLVTPRAAAFAGILFALLFTASVTLIRTTIPDDLSGSLDWVTSGNTRLSIALFLMPLAGIAFLWFIGVIRDQMGELEDRFFSTIFLGSGLLFLAMVFVAMAIAGGIVATAELEPERVVEQDVYLFGRAIMLQVSNVYALRMAGVFMSSLGTVWMRTGLMPRWLVVVTYFLSAALLLVIDLSLWVTLVFPAWVFLISVIILVRNMRRAGKEAAAA